ncbi:hypothetical protein CVT24_002698 [Panaeolus cyanescens]|uniref:Uncharacterized protein n=1 Tax=Panaeolus cyanescens TaxID=181874 RepID=A0A409YY89_9AGAR|nr:hypothetical protein CVT24_002698 [Panaeolus cyanescens]
MAAELSVLSFLCAILLAVFLPIKRIYTDAPKLAIILWLFAYNLINAINSVIWTDNNDIHAVGWCDLATKIMMAASMALPGAFLCLSRRLEMLSSSREMSTHQTVVRNRMIFEIVLCCILPILYMSLHFVAQDHRFDLVRNFGCSPSVHESTLAFILIWGPPLILSTVSLVLSAFAMHHACRLPSHRFMEHLQLRSTTTTTTLFYRQLAVTIIISSLLAFFNIFVFFSVSHYVPWTSWASVHAAAADINFLPSSSTVKTIQVRWWSVFVVSIIYISLSFAFGEETRDAYRYMKALFSRSSEPSPSGSRETAPSSAPNPAKTKGSKMRPLTLELKSGWDDMLHEKSPRLKSIRSKSPMHSSASACSSPTPSSKSRMEDDEAFMNSTLSYLGSPTAKSLGISSPVTPTTPSPRVAFELLSNPFPTPPPPVASTQPTAPVPKTPPRPAPAKLPSHITSVLSEAWPVPPASPSPSRSVSRHGTPSPTGSISRAHMGLNSRPDSRPQSPAASLLDENIDLSEITFGIALYSPSTPPHLRARPFENSSISSMNELGVHTPTTPSTPMAPRRGILKRPSIRSLNRKISRERLSSGSSTLPAGDIIRMSVVHETV